jgi:2-polyprenyl-3-methyl-5-hydroxy-6-metoxy-1,4-benzoquinol methylase
MTARRAGDQRMTASSAACPACGESRFVAALRVGPVVVRRCVGCGLGCTVPAPAEADGRERFAEDAAYFRDALAQPKDRWWHRFRRAPLDLLEAGGARPGLRLLDVGCNVGYLLAAARERGFRAHGLDGSAAAVAVGRAAFGLELQVGRIEAAAVELASQDVVVLNHVLEHLPEPWAALDLAQSWLRPGGWLLVGLPNFASPIARRAGARWAGLVLDQHVWHFTPIALRRLVASAGFVRIRWRTCMLTYAPRGFAGWAKWLVRRALEPLGAADNLLLVARRPPVEGAP